MNKIYQYDIPPNEVVCHILHTSYLKKSLDFYRKLGINFVRDENNFFVKYVARPNRTCVFELYLAGDAVKSSPNLLKLVVNNLEEKVSLFGNLAQIQQDGSYLISDPDLRILQVYDVKHFESA